MRMSSVKVYPPPQQQAGGKDVKVYPPPHQQAGGKDVKVYPQAVPGTRNTGRTRDNTHEAQAAPPKSRYLGAIQKKKRTPSTSKENTLFEASHWLRSAQAVSDKASKTVRRSIIAQARELLPDLWISQQSWFVQSLLAIHYSFEYLIV